MLSLVAGTAGLILCPWTTGVGTFWAPSVLVGIASGASLPWLMLLISEECPSRLHGLAVGIRMTVNQAANTAAPMFVGISVGIAGMASGFLAAGGVATGCLVIGWRFGPMRGQGKPRLAPSPEPEWDR